MGRFHKSHECWNTRPAASEDLCSRYPSMCHSLPVLKFYGNLVIYSHTARCADKDPLIEFRKRRQVCLCVGPGTWNIWANVCNSAKTLTTLALKWHIMGFVHLHCSRQRMHANVGVCLWSLYERDDKKSDWERKSMCTTPVTLSDVFHFMCEWLLARISLPHRRLRFTQVMVAMATAFLLHFVIPVIAMRTEQPQNPHFRNDIKRHDITS